MHNSYKRKRGGQVIYSDFSESSSSDGLADCYETAAHRRQWTLLYRDKIRGQVVSVKRE